MKKLLATILFMILCGMLVLSMQNNIAKSFINNPSKLAVYASPPVIIADGSSTTGLSVQLLDSSGNPTIAPQDMIVTLASSNTSVITLSTTTVTIGKSYSSVCGHPGTAQPWAKSNATAGTVIINASALGLTSSSVSIKTMPASSNPSKIALYVQPPKLLVHDSATMAIQLLDANNAPAIAPTGGVTVGLSSNASGIANPSVSSILIPAGADHVIGHPTDIHPYLSTTYIPGVAMISATSFGLTGSSVTIKTFGETPYRLRLYASPTKLIADGSSFAMLTVQLLDQYGNPSIAPSGGIAVTFQCSNKTVVDLGSNSTTIAEGKSYWRTWLSHWVGDSWISPFAKTTISPGVATINVSAPGLLGDQVAVTTYPSPSNGPQKLAIYADPTNLIPACALYPDNPDSGTCSLSLLTAQLLDQNGAPALAPSGGTIMNLASNDTGILNVNPGSLTIPTGANFVTGYYYQYMWSYSWITPWCEATSKPGTANVTATSSGIAPASITISTVEKVQTPTNVTVQLNPYNINAGDNVNLSGKLSNAISGAGISSATIGVYYSTNYGVSWHFAANLSTNSTGWYGATGPLNSPGTYLVKVQYAGSPIYGSCFAISQPLHVNPLTMKTYLFFNATPNPASPGQTVALRGILVYVDLGNNIGPVANALLNMSYSTDYGTTWNAAGNVTTGSNGLFQKTFTAPAVGVYLYKLYYAGSTSYDSVTCTSFLIVR